MPLADTSPEYRRFVQQATLGARITLYLLPHKLCPFIGGTLNYDNIDINRVFYVVRLVGFCVHN